VLEAWARAFGVWAKNEDPEDLAGHVTRRVLLLRDEIEAVRGHMRHTPIRPERVEMACDAARRATTMRNLETQWAIAAQHIGPHVIGAFEMWADLLPEEERAVEPESRKLLS
jgi:hypothetical protein